MEIESVKNLLTHLEKMSKFKTIVFGGSGFLGSHIADALSNSGHEVTIYDLVESPFLRDDQKMIIGSLQDKEFLQKAISGKDFLYHFAGVADIDFARNNPEKTYLDNVIDFKFIRSSKKK